MAARLESGPINRLLTVACGGLGLVVTLLWVSVLGERNTSSMVPGGTRPQPSGELSGQESGIDNSSRAPGAHDPGDLSTLIPLGQQEGATVLGVVQDDDGAPLGGIRLILRATQGKHVIKVLTARTNVVDGTFIFPLLTAPDPCDVTVDVQAQGDGDYWVLSEPTRISVVDGRRYYFILTGTRHVIQIEGLILDGYGAGVPGAEVTARGAPSVTTDDQGRFAIAVPLWSDSVMLECSALLEHGRQSTRKQVIITSEWRNAGRLSGVIIGFPVLDNVLSIYVRDEGGTPLHSARISNPVAGVERLTGTDGSAVVPVSGSDGASLVVGADGYSTRVVFVAPDSTDAVIIMCADVLLRGVVVDGDGQAVARAVVQVSDRTDGAGNIALAITDSLGGFSFRARKVGTPLFFEVSASDGRRGRSQKSPQWRGDVVEIRVTPVTAVRGFVIDSGGVPQARVLVRADYARGVSHTDSVAESSVLGEFEVLVNAEDCSRVVFSKEGFSVTEVECNAVNGRTIVLRPAGVLAFYVVDNLGAPYGPIEAELFRHRPGLEDERVASKCYSPNGVMTIRPAGMEPGEVCILKIYDSQGKTMRREARLAKAGDPRTIIQWRPQ